MWNEREVVVAREIPIALKRSMWQMPALIALAFVIALGVNHWRSDGIPIVGAWSAEARFSDAADESPVIFLIEARHLFEEDSAVFVDARPKSRYTEGHIPGALSLPWPEVDRRFTGTADLPAGPEMIITYCDGESWEPSHELALFLRKKGYENVRVLANGWTGWQEAGLPRETGE